MRGKEQEILLERETQRNRKEKYNEKENQREKPANCCVRRIKIKDECNRVLKVVGNRVNQRKG